MSSKRTWNNVGFGLMPYFKLRIFKRAAVFHDGGYELRVGSIYDLNESEKATYREHLKEEDWKTLLRVSQEPKSDSLDSGFLSWMFEHAETKRFKRAWKLIAIASYKAAETYGDYFWPKKYEGPRTVEEINNLLKPSV